jgi:hypothetical protein
MPRKKKHPRELTTDEAVRKLFPKEAIRHAKEHAQEGEKPQVRGPKPSIKGKDS